MTDARAAWLFYLLIAGLGFLTHLLARIALPGYRARSDQLGLRRAAGIGALVFMVIGVFAGIVREPDTSGKASYLVMFVILAGVGWLVLRKFPRKPEE